MTTFISYALQANLALLFFFIGETLFFRNEKSFAIRRFFLLGGLIIAIGIPLLKQWISLWPAETLNLSAALPPITVSYSIEGKRFGLEKMIEIFYFVGLAVFAFHFLRQFFQLFNALNKPLYQWKELSVYEGKESHHVFSFFKFVSMDNSERFSPWEKNKILQHELVHAQRWHSLDVLFVSAVQILFWFNPLLYFYKRKLIQLHEFEADARSVENDEVDLYCGLLAKVALQSAGFTLANHFVQPFTLNRILMMKSANKKMRLWKIIMTTSCTVIFLSMMCFYKPVMAQDNKQEEVMTFVDEMPTYEGGFDKLAQALSKELKYPAEARKNKIQGVTLLQFVIEKDGTISSAIVKKGFDKECDKEALRAIQAINTKWVPGKKSGKTVRTQMTMPITFKL